jgi:SAM-dependent methyltransferase
MQGHYTGNSEDATLREGFAAYLLFKQYYETHVGPLADARGVLDFGCGWGRIIRFFLRDVPHWRMMGVDPSAEAIEACSAMNRWNRLEQIGMHPPTSLPSNSFDLIYLYSVFSHLPEEMHLTLLREFERLLVPGGLLIATTRGKDIFHFCQTMRDQGVQHQCAGIFRDEGAAVAAYDRGEFCWEGFGAEGEWSVWGEAAIPRQYVERVWSEMFEVLDYVDDRAVCEQNVIAVRKREKP